MTERFISMKEAAEKLKVRRQTLYHYIGVLKLEKRRFPLDRQSYLSMSDFERIKKLREEAAERSAQSDDIRPAA